MRDARLIGLDWGTSALRAYLYAEGGRVVAQRHLDSGILRVPDGRFEEAFRSACGDWLASNPGVPVLASGMIGSRQGWREAPYVDTPAGFDELTRGFATVRTGDGTTLRIVPGVSTLRENGVHDVMRGEETQVAGALHRLGIDDGVIVLPGTHSKWVRVAGRRIASLRTYMTGELYAVLSAHSILGRLFAQAAASAEPAGADATRDAAFHDGLRRAAEDPAGITSTLFSVRAEGLFGRYDGTALPAYLSGLLIGVEIAHARTELRRDGAEPPLAVVAADALAHRYADALGFLGLRASIVDGAPAADGLWRIAVAAMLVRA